MNIDYKQCRSALYAADRLLRNGATDGASITVLFFAAGEFPPEEIYNEQDTMHELPEEEILRVTKLIGGSDLRLVG